MSFSSPSSDFVLLASTDASASSSISFDGYFSSTYKNYFVLYNTVRLSADSFFCLRFRRSSADITTNNYWTSNLRTSVYIGSVGGGYDTLGSSYKSTYSNINLTTNSGTSTANYSSAGNFYLYNPLTTDYFKMITGNSNVMLDTQYVYNFSFGGGLVDSADPLSGISFYPASGTITTGNFKLYGIK